jgi:Cdc6-like AAA superfamily ATPase
MKYGIIRTRNDGTNAIIHIVSNKNEFRNYTKNEHKFSKYIDCVTLAELKHNNCFNEGYYLVEMGNTIHYIEKTNETNKGLLFTSEQSTMNEITKYTIMEYLVKDHEVNFWLKDNEDDKQKAIDNFVLSPDSEEVNKEINYVDNRSGNSCDNRSGNSCDNSDSDSHIDSYSESESDSHITSRYCSDSSDSGDSSSDNSSTYSNVLSCVNSSHDDIIREDLTDLNLSLMPDYPNILIIGKRCSGKSASVLNLVDELANENILVVSPIEKHNAFYTKAYPNAKNVDSINNKLIRDFLYDSNEGIIILDDCADSASFYNSPIYDEIMINASVLRKSVITTSQYPASIDQSVRIQYDYVFISKFVRELDQTKLYDYYGGYFRSFNSFKKILENSTQDYGFMAINMYKIVPKDSTIRNHVYKFKTNPKFINCFIKNMHFNSDATVAIKKFDLNSMVSNPHINIIGKRGSGKSFMITDLLKKKINNNPELEKNILIISPTDKRSDFYKTLFPNAEVKYRYTSDLIAEYLNTKDGIIVLDDCLSSSADIKKDKILCELLFNGRHYKKTVIMAMQFPLGIPPDLRNNFDYVFLFADDFFSNQKRLYDHYAGMFPSFNDFRNVFLKLTTNYGCMTISNKGTKDISNKICWYKSMPHTTLPKIKCTPTTKSTNKMATTTLHCDRFNWDRSKPNPSICVIGKRGTGKTTLTKDILKRIYFDSPDLAHNTLIINPSEKFNKEYSSQFCFADVKYKFDINDLKKIISSSDPGIVVFDNCFSSTDILKDKYLLELVFNGKHLNKTIIFNISWPLDFPLKLRSTFDYVFLFNDDFISNQKRLYSQYCGMFPNFNTFKKTLKCLTHDHVSMVISNCNNSTNINDKIFWYRAISD